MLPIEYQKKESIFLGRSFFVDKRVHIPRKNTEPQILSVIRFINKNKRPVICADIGTGPGIIPITFLLDCLFVKKCIATDISASALMVAKKNIKKFKLENKIICKKGNLLGPIRRKKVDIIVANLPYESDESYPTKPFLVYEPKISVYAGNTGLEVMEHFFQALKTYRFLSSTTVFMKVPPQKKAVKKLLLNYMPHAKPQFKKRADNKWGYLMITF
jgi:release factor glutamine methyltransferase